MAAPQVATRTPSGVRLQDGLERLWAVTARVSLRVIVVLVVALAVAPVALALLGYQPAVVDTDAMAPDVMTGDLVVNEPVAAVDVTTGDVVTFSDANRGGATFTERVVSAQPVGGSVIFSTTTDSDPVLHHWSAPSREQVDRLAYKVPGHPMQLATSPAIQAAGLGLLVVGGTVGLMRRR